MKNLLFAALTILLLTSSANELPAPAPAQVTITNGGTVTLADTNEVEVLFTSKANDAFSRYAFVYIVSTTSGVQVSSGETIAGTNQAWATDSKIPISFFNGVNNIRLKGGAGDIIAITY